MTYITTTPVYDGRLMGPTYASSQSYYSDSDHDSPFRRPSSPYPLSRSTISRLRDPFYKCTRNLGWNIDWAVAYLVDHLEKTRNDAAEGLRTIRIKAATLSREGLDPEDIIYKTVNRLDATLFKGHLKDAVYLSTLPLPPSLSGATYNANWGPDPGVTRISIVLNSGLLEYARARDVVALLIHQMIHAYFLVACGPQKENEVEYGRLAHGKHFGQILTTIKDISATHGKELVGLDFGHDVLIDDEVYPRRRKDNDSEDEAAKWYCTHCHASTASIPTRDLTKWYTKTIAPLLSPSLSTSALRSANVQIYNERRHTIEVRSRARLPPSTETIEVLYNDTSTLLDREKIEENVLSARRALTCSRFLKISDNDVDEATFTRFMEYVHTGTYRPSPLYGGYGNGRGGLVLAPTAGHRRDDGDAHVLADILFVKFGTSYHLSECVEYGLKRLDSYSIVDEDPIDILTHIFSGREPCAKLRSWVARFLRAGPSSLSLFARTHTDNTNLATLENENGPWRARFLALLDTSGGLENEVRKARDDLVTHNNNTWEASNALMLSGLNDLRITPGSTNNVHQNLLTLNPFPLNASNTNQALIDTLQHQYKLQQQQQQLLIANLPSTPIGANLNRLTSSAYDPIGTELDHLRTLERQKIRELEQERNKLRKLETEKERVRETVAHVQMASVLEGLYGTGIGIRGFVEEDSEGYD
jgi:hypothetical protein